MSRGQNSIKRSDISAVPILLKYSASYDSSSFVNYGITINRGTNTSFDQSGIQFLNFAMVRQMYYQEYLTGSLKFSSSFWNPSIQSTAASGTFDNDYRYFPTSASAEVTILAIPRNVFGEQIARKSFLVTSSAYQLIDDGNGNIVDADDSYLHVGNILYSQGIAVITNEDYQNAMIPYTGPTTTTTSTTTTTTTPVPTTTTTSTTSTSTTSTTTTLPPTTTTSTTTSTTTLAPTTTTTSTTSTTTTVAPTTTTSTTTSTTTIITYSVDVYAKQGDTPPASCGIYYRFGIGGTEQFLATVTPAETTCALQGTITGVPTGTNLYIGFLAVGGNISFNAVIGSNSCPANTNTYCGTTGYNTTISSNTDISMTTYVSGGVYEFC